MKYLWNIFFLVIIFNQKTVIRGLIENKDLSCIENSQNKEIMKSCLSYKVSKDKLFKIFADKSKLKLEKIIYNLKNYIYKHETKIDINKKFDNFFNLDFNKQYNEINNLIVKFKNNKIIKKKLYSINVYIHKYKVLDEIYTENNLDYYENIKKNLNNDLENFQKSNELNSKWMIIKKKNIILNSGKQEKLKIKNFESQNLKKIYKNPTNSPNSLSKNTYNSVNLKINNIHQYNHNDYSKPTKFKDLEQIKPKEDNKVELIKLDKINNTNKNLNDDKLAKKPLNNIINGKKDKKSKIKKLSVIMRISIFIIIFIIN